MLHVNTFRIIPNTYNSILHLVLQIKAQKAHPVSKLGTRKHPNACSGIPMKHTKGRATEVPSLENLGGM